jgi:TPR repeat protein
VTRKSAVRASVLATIVVFGPLTIDGQPAQEGDLHSWYEPHPGQHALGAECLAVLGKCHEGEATACTEVGDSFRLRQQPCQHVSRACAQAAYVLACDGGTVGGCIGLTLLLEKARPEASALMADAYLKAGAILRAGCDKGDPEACAGLAAEVSGGFPVGVDEDPAVLLKRAERLYEAKCRQGVAVACTDLGKLYDRTRAYPSEAERAGVWRRACDLGEGYACGVLGEGHIYGAPGVAKDPKQGVEFLERACELGQADCCDWVARLYKEGTVVAKDLGRAARFYQRGCTGGSCVSCRNLADMLDAGVGVPKDAAEAKRLRALPCAEGSDDEDEGPDSPKRR